ncbi:hypothetical protein AAZX31_07G074700 [Glycine max]
MQFVGIFVQVLPHLKSVCLHLKSGLGYLKLLPYELWRYESIVKELDRGFNNLQRERKRIGHKVKEEENRYGRAIDDDVIKWLQEADKIISEYDDFRLDEDSPYAVFCDGYLPKPSIRFRLSRIAVDLARRGNVLLQSANPDWLGRSSTDADFQSFASRNQTKKRIVDALADSNVGVIGVYGWSGVGKTSLIKEVAKEVKGKMFDVVIMVNVSFPEIRNIQGQIADRLGMILEEESESGRAARIRERLKNPKEKTLIILDDMEVKLDFGMLGIPFDDTVGSQMNNKKKNPLAHHKYAMKTEEFEASSLMKIEEPIARYTGCKILMISDSEQLLISQMGGKGIQTFSVEALTDKEAKKMFMTMAEIIPLMEKKAETMFKTMAEIIALREMEAETMSKIMTEMIGDENSKFEKLAAQIAKRCKGLPMTIVTTAKALKNKSLVVWEKAYLDLGKQNLTAMPEFSTKLSYDLLENEELKHTFLICARMGRDALITDLVRYCIGLGFLQGIYTVREARDRVYALVGKLKELSLLSDSFSIDHFTMHDIIRDVALSIASQEMHAFALTKGRLDEWPKKRERYTAISLQHCDVTDIMKKFPESIDCCRLRIFHLDNMNPRLEIPDNFFNGMKELRVLILIGIHLLSLPSSIKCLKELRMFCLERCKLAENLSIIGELEELRVLSLSGSDIECLPIELRKLAKLQIFDISNCFELKKIPADVLSSLTSLEELYVGKSPIQWKDEEGQGNQNGDVSLSELRQLNQLTALDIQIPKMTHFHKNLFFDQLNSYKIIIRDFNAYPAWDFKMLEMCEASRYLALQLENGFDIRNRMEIKLLFKRVESLLLGQLNDVKDIFNELNYEGFPYLKYLSILSNSKVKSIINSENPTYPEKAFPKLESLFLYDVSNMEHICHGQLTNDSFRKLKIIRLKICGQLKNVFFSSMLKHLSALETIEVSECNSLKDIVTLESNKDHIKFPELRSLTLQSLSEFVGFYTLDASMQQQVPNWKPGDQLFDEEVVVFKLERMELSSIKIRKIWNDHPLTRLYFQNLIHLDVNDCWNLRYLLSLSMSKGLMNLQSLFVSECGMMESIFMETEGSVIEIEGGSIFPNLKNINLTSMKRLTQIWPPKIPLHSFGKLHELIIDRCNKLENVFPSYMVGSFLSLCDLKVTNCKSMEKIFDLKSVGKRRAWNMITSLQNVHVKALPKLEHVWNEDPGGILRFTYLKKIWVQECLKLKHIFPVSIAMNLKNLEYLEVWNCAQLKEIVFRGETIKESSVLFEFPKLTTARFSKLPNLESFFGGAHELRCSTLYNLSVEHCHKLWLFRTEIANPEEKSVFLPEEVIRNMKSMQIEPRDANSLKRYRMHKLEECQLSGIRDTEILYFLLHRNPNLKSLLLSNCFFEQLVTSRSLVNDNLGVVPMLKSLKLMNLASLKTIGFEEYTVLFRMLECLILKHCPCLNSIASSSVSFTYLTNLEVSNCNKLSYLLTPPTAKSLVQLTTMKVIQCESMKTIVFESEQEKTELNIIFRQLKEIELEALHELKCFCGSYCCAIEFPSLEKVVVSACSKMEGFTFSEQANKTPNLRQICVRRGKEEERLYWVRDLNATIRSLYKIRALDPDMAASNPYMALKIHQLKTLKLVNCIESNAIPTVVFSSLKNLEELEVSSTNVEVIFGIMEADMKGYTLRLKKMTLDNLPNLIQVWDKDREGILSFQNLQEVLVANCEKLKTVFPTELAKRIVKLEKLEIRHCEVLQEIVEEANAITEEPTEFSFPHLTSLNLHMLPQLSCFYPGRFTLECPALNHLEVLSCDNLEKFQNQQEAQCSTSVTKLPLFSEGKTIFILESLKLYWEIARMLCNKKFLKDMLHKLVELELDFNDVREVPNFVVEFAALLERTSNLEYLQISRCRVLEELFPSQPEQGDTKTLGHLTTSSLVRLQKLCVSSCGHLTTLVHLPMSFSNLKHLSVKDCHGLKCLFTSTTAKKLVHLEEMYIMRCKSVEEILAKELEDTTTSEAIQFERLNTIILDSLSSLSCFYSGNEILLLSSLIKVLIWECPNMKIFSQGDIEAESFMGIQVSLDPNEDLFFHQDLNNTVKRRFQQNELFEALDNESISDNLELKVDWHGKVGLENKWLDNLMTLKPDNCTLPNAIPSATLPHSETTEEFEVQNSIKVKEEGTAANVTQKFVFPRLENWNIHDLPQQLFPSAHLMNKDEGTSTSINSHPLILSLKVISNPKELRLDWKHNPALLFEKLHELDVFNFPHLTNLVYSTSRLSFSRLKKVSTFNCPHMQHLFTYSEAKKLMNIEEITNKECESVTEIIAKDGDENEHKGEGSSTLNSPSLKEVGFTKCYSTKLFHLGDKVRTILKVTIDGVDWEGDINSAPMQQFEEEAA